MIIGRKEGYLQAESDMEEEIKDKLYQAFREIEINKFLHSSFTLTII